MWELAGKATARQTVGQTDGQTHWQTHRRIVQNNFSRRFEGRISQIRSYLEVEFLHDANTSLDMEVKHSGGWIVTEVLAPQRPPSPPTEYFQLKLGGYDPYNLVRIPGADSPHLTGYVGCMRGFKIGDTVYDLQAQATKGLGKYCNVGQVLG